MSPEQIFHTGIVIIAATVAAAIIVFAVLQISKSVTNKKLDAEYGKRRK